MVSTKKLAEALGVSPQAIDAARNDGRITSFVREGRKILFDLDRASSEYLGNTRQPKHNSSLKPTSVPMIGFEGDEDDEQTEYWIDKNPKTWKINQAQTAKAIFDAQIKRLEYEAQSKNYLPAKDVEREILRITTEFSRALVGLPAKLKQKIDKLDTNDLELIKDLCSEIILNCEANL